MPGNWLRSSSLRIMVDVMLPAMTKQLATEIFNPLDEFPALHPTSISSIFLIPGKSWFENSW